MSTAAQCCAEFYEQDWVAALIGESFHPGGLELTERMVDSLALPAGAKVLDLACGRGQSTELMQSRFSLAATGIDASASNLESAGCCSAATYVQGVAQELPFAAASFDAVVCECAVSTFEDQPRVAAEVARVLRPGGRLAISDVVVEGDIPSELMDAVGPWACVDGALSSAGYRDLFESAGLRLVDQVDEADAVRTMFVEIKRRLAVIGLGQLAGVELPPDLDPPRIRALLGTARELLDRGVVGYQRFTFAPAAAQ